MKALVKKKAIIENIKNKKLGIEYLLKDYDKMVVGALKFDFLTKVPDTALVEFELPELNGCFSVWIPAEHIYVEHKQIKNHIPLSLWAEAEKFGLLFRIARKKEEYYDNGLLAHDLTIRDNIFGSHFPDEVVEICYDKNFFGCAFCRTQSQLTVDHIIPVFWLRSKIFEQFYSVKLINTRKNKQVLCVSCNSEKANFEKSIYSSYDLTHKVNSKNINPVVAVEKILEYCKKKTAWIEDV